jgi:D-serine deaminase-like pyridoxal phosphate-dependent protein
MPLGNLKTFIPKHCRKFATFALSQLSKMSFKGRKLDELPSPSFIVDINKVKRNCDRMKQRCDSLGVKLRPHMKTHKTL